MSKIISSNKSNFEVHKHNDTSVIFKRVLPSKGRKPKVLHKLEMGLPKVTMTYFDEDDLARLREIEGRISGKFPNVKRGRLIQVVEGVKRFIVE